MDGNVARCMDQYKKLSERVNLEAAQEIAARHEHIIESMRPLVDSHEEFLSDLDTRFKEYE